MSQPEARPVSHSPVAAKGPDSGHRAQSHWGLTPGSGAPGSSESRGPAEAVPGEGGGGAASVAGPLCHTPSPLAPWQ